MVKPTHLFKIGVVCILAIIWTFLSYHYWSVLRDYVEMKLYVTNPCLYVAVEFMYLICVVMLTYLAIKALDYLGEGNE